MEKLYTSSEASKLLNLSQSRVVKFAKESGTVGHKQGRDWAFTLQDIQKIEERKGKVGRPKKEKTKS